MKLSQAKRGKRYKILGYSQEIDRVSRRFLELGFTRGQSLKIVQSSLSNKVFLIEIRGYLLSVRVNLLSRIEVQEC